MMDCTFTPNADGLYQCTQCGWVYPRPADKPPRRNCPNGTARPAPPTPAAAVLARYDASPNPLSIAREEVERRLAVCESCDQFHGYACIRAGSPCQRPGHWQLKVLTLDCERWHGPENVER